MLASLTKQISTHRPYIPKIVQHLGEFKNKGGRPDSKMLEEASVTSMYGFSAVYIIIDALDEFPVVNNERKKLEAYILPRRLIAFIFFVQAARNST